MIPRIATDLIEVQTVAGEPFTLTHELGRQVGGWLVVWSTAPISLHVTDAAADTRQRLTLTPSASATVRLVLL